MRRRRVGLDAEPSASKSCRFAVGVPDPDPGPSPSPSSRELSPPPPPLPVPSDDEVGGEGSSGSAGLRRRSPGRARLRRPWGRSDLRCVRFFFLFGIPLRFVSCASLLRVVESGSGRGGDFPRDSRLILVSKFWFRGGKKKMIPNEISNGFQEYKFKTVRFDCNLDKFGE